jgi:hypothetical protein
MPKPRSDHGLGETFASPEHGLGLNNIDKRTPDATYPSIRIDDNGMATETTGLVSGLLYIIQDELPCAFTILITISTTTTQITHPQDGLGYTSEPPTMTSALFLVKIGDTGAEHPSLDKRQPQG